MKTFFKNLFKNYTIRRLDKLYIKNRDTILRNLQNKDYKECKLVFDTRKKNITILPKNTNIDDADLILNVLAHPDLHQKELDEYFAASKGASL